MVPELERLIQAHQNIVFFGGAGVSTESGIPDFRSVDGLYHQKFKYPPETMLSHTFYETHTAEFFDFYRQKLIVHGAKPNAAHLRLAALEREGKCRAVVTQNIDGLHQDAGSQKVIELHGTVRRNLCLSCGKTYGLDTVLAQQGTPHCTCGGMLRPDIVFYGEPLNSDVMDEALRAVMDCDLLIVGGTSLTVYPAAGLLNYRREAKLALINRDATPYDQRADLVVRDPIAAALDAAIPQ